MTSQRRLGTVLTAHDSHRSALPTRTSANATVSVVCPGSAEWRLRDRRRLRMTSHDTGSLAVLSATPNPRRSAGDHILNRTLVTGEVSAV